MLAKFYIIAAIALSVSASAQTTLPYYTAFDNAAEQLGWQSFRKGVTVTSDWVYITFGSYSAPNSIYHYYPVGAASTDTTVDWWVSPQFNFEGGAKIDSMRVNIYSFTGSVQPEDFCGLYLLEGSPDPSLATFAILLANFTSLASSSGIYFDTTNIPIPSIPGACFLAIKYVATNDWFEAGIDDIQISALSAGIENNIKSPSLRIYPNPATNILSLETDNSSVSNILITDIMGNVLKSIFLVDSENQVTIDISELQNGIYFLKTTDRNSCAAIKFTKQ